MSDREIRVEDVMNYYSKWIGSEESAIVVINHTRRMLPKFNSLSFSSKMSAVRDYLVYEMNCDVPFICGYRRMK